MGSDEQLIIPPINGDKGLSVGLYPLGNQLSPLVTNGDNVLSSQLYPLVTNGDNGLSIRLYPLTPSSHHSNLLGVQVRRRTFLEKFLQIPHPYTCTHGVH